MERETQRRTRGLALACLLAAACGGGRASLPGSERPPGTPIDEPTAFVITTDFDATGSFATFPLRDPSAVQTNLGPIHSDAVARVAGNLVYVVNRLGGDNIQALDPGAGFATLWQCSVGNGTNPHDFVYAGPNKAYVTLYEESEILIVDPSVGPTCAGFVRGSVDLSRFADDDGIPEMDQAVLVEDRLWVTLQRLARRDFFEPSDASLLVAIDIRSDTIVDLDPDTAEIDAIRLQGTNPFSGSEGLTIDRRTGKMLLGKVGSFGTIGDGGIEVVNLFSGRSEGFLITEDEPGGNITDFAVLDDDTAYAVVTDLEFNNLLVRFSPRERRVTATLLRSAEYLVDVAIDPMGERLYLTDRTLTGPGIRIFDARSGTALTAAPVGTGLPPFGVLFLAP